MSDPDVSANADRYWTRELEKKVADRVQVILTDPDLLKLHQRFGGAMFRRSSVFHGLRKFLTDHAIGGRRCFEIGTFNGITAIVLSRFFDEVVSVDIVDRKEKNRLARHLGITNIRFVHVADNDEKRRVADGCDFDFAYMDGNHAEDTASDFALVRRCGRVLFQEVWRCQAPVWDLVHSLPRAEVTLGGDGLALWRRP